MTDTASAVTDQVPEMVERVARAIIDTTNATPLLGTRDAYYQHLARAAIAAMHEPTGAMRAAGVRTIPLDDPVGTQERDEARVLLTWRAMIRAALG